MIAETETVLHELDVRIPSAQGDHSGAVRRPAAGRCHRSRDALGGQAHTDGRADRRARRRGNRKVESIILGLKARGLPILMISHNLDQVFRLSDRICVLRRGKQIGVRPTQSVDKNEIVSMITGLSRGEADA